MEQTTPSRLTPPPIPPDFGPWLRDQLTDRGYHMSQRGGGQGAFAKDTGLSPAMVSRLLRGVSGNDPETLRVVAAALHLPAAELFVRSGLLTEDDLAVIRGSREAAIRDRPAITPEEAVADLERTDPDAAAAITAAITAAVAAAVTAAQARRRAKGAE